MNPPEILDYDPEYEELVVAFPTRQNEFHPPTYIYGGVTSEMVDDIESAPSIRKAINELKANATYVKKQEAPKGFTSGDRGRSPTSPNGPPF